jgi:hypothetical protein
MFHEGDKMTDTFHKKTDWGNESPDQSFDILHSVDSELMTEVKKKILSYKIQHNFVP